VPPRLTLNSLSSLLTWCPFLTSHSVLTRTSADVHVLSPTLSLHTEGAPPGFFIDMNTGEILGAPTKPSADSRVPTTMTLWAEDGSGVEALIETLQITVVAPLPYVHGFHPTAVHGCG
jgi:hypothetical protein